MKRRWGLIPFGILLSTCWAVGSNAGGPLPDRPASISAFLALDDRPAVIAHRGFSAARPENTLAAVEAAIDVGADMVEVDVTLSSDGHVVCIHDDTLGRTTNGSGPVVALTLDQLQQLDAGSWFSPQWANQKIPTLAQVLTTTRGRILINIEIKPEAVTEVMEGGIAQQVMQLINELKMADQVIISSFEPLALQHVRAVDPSLATASLFNKELHRIVAPRDIVGAVSSKALNISKSRVNPELVDRCRTLHIPIGVYTVNTKPAMRDMIRMGVGAIFTNQPDQLLEVIRESPQNPVRSAG